MARIRVKQKTTGKTGTISAENFNPALYERISEAEPQIQPSARIIEKPTNGESNLTFGDFSDQPSFSKVEPAARSSMQFGEFEQPEPEKKKPTGGIFGSLREFLFPQKKKEEIQPQGMKFEEAFPEEVEAEKPEKVIKPINEFGMTKKQIQSGLTNARKARSKKYIK